MRNTVPQGKVRRGVRIAKKKSSNRPKPNYRLLFSIFFISVLINAGNSYAVRTPDLVVREVKIKGVRLADQSIVKKTAKAALGQNILLLKKSPILNSIRQLSEVSEVHMGRSFPDKVWVRVIERKADCVLLANQKYYLMQSNGFVFHSVKEPVKGMTVLIVAKCSTIKIGKTACSPCVQDALEALKYVHKERLTVDKISVDHDGDMCLNMESGFYVKLGQPEDVAGKLSILRRTLAYKPSISRDAVYVDISCPLAPVWKPKAFVQAST